MKVITAELRSEAARKTLHDIRNRRREQHHGVRRRHRARRRGIEAELASLWLRERTGHVGRILAGSPTDSDLEHYPWDRTSETRIVGGPAL